MNAVDFTSVSRETVASATASAESPIVKPAKRAEKKRLPSGRLSSSSVSSQIRS